MFTQYRFIDPNHHVALESCIRTHTTVTPQLLSRLYEAALANTTGASGSPEMLTSHVSNDQVQIGFATDQKTGIYVQLAQLKDRKGRMLTVGQKWAAEKDNPVQGNTSIIFW